LAKRTRKAVIEAAAGFERNPTWEAVQRLWARDANCIALATPIHHLMQAVGQNVLLRRRPPALTRLASDRRLFGADAPAIVLRCSSDATGFRWQVTDLADLWYPRG
jgi:hypothetical protein